MKNFISRCARSKTMRFAVILMALGVLQNNSEFLKTVLSPDVFGYFTILVGIIVGALRIVTSQAWLDK